MEKRNDVCVYLHINKRNGEIFYVGIGIKRRPWEKNGRNVYWHEYVKSNDYEVKIIHSGLNWKDAAKKEKQLIVEIGRKDKGNGTLVNLSNGGEYNNLGGIFQRDNTDEFIKFTKNYPLICNIFDMELTQEPKANFNLHNTRLNFKCKCCNHRWAQTPKTIIRRFNVVIKELSLDVIELSSCNTSQGKYKIDIDRYMCNICYPLEGFKYYYHKNNSDVLEIFNIDNDVFENKKSSILQQKVRRLMHCYTIRDFVFINDNIFSFKISKKFKTGIIFKDEKTYFGKFNYYSSDKKLCLEKLQNIDI